MAASSDDPNVIRFVPRRRFVAEARDRVRLVGDRKHREHRSHAAAASIGQALAAVRYRRKLPPWFSISVSGPRLDAEPLEEVALRHRAMNRAADVFRCARQRLEIDMGGDVGLAGIFQRIGECMAGDRLEGVAHRCADGRNR